jgi:hypothetical protein
MNDDYEVVKSPLCQSISSGGKSIEVEIYPDGQGGWILEVVDEYNNSTVWDESFATDIAALTEAKKTILSDGVSTLIGPKSGKGEWTSDT